MDASLAESLSLCFLVFCRLGCCLMLLPGFSNAHVPMRVRLYMALMLTVFVLPLVEPAAAAKAATGAGTMLAIPTECIAGAWIGMVSRLLIAGLEWCMVGVSAYLGLSGITDVVDGGEPRAAVATLITTTATLILLLVDFPVRVVALLVDSYDVLPLGAALDARDMLLDVSQRFAAATRIGFRLSSPYLVFGVLVNLMLGVANRLVPQFPVFALASPLLALGGLPLLAVGAEFMLSDFAASFEQALELVIRR